MPLVGGKWYSDYALKRHKQNLRFKSDSGSLNTPNSMYVFPKKVGKKKKGNFYSRRRFR